LTEQAIWYEKHEEVEEERTIVFFGVKKADQQKGKHLNNLAIGKYRDKFIPFKAARIFVIILGLLIVLAAIVGYLFSRF